MPEMRARIRIAMDRARRVLHKRSRRASPQETLGPDSPEAKRLRAALEMRDLGIAMYRQRMRRENPQATDADIDAMVREWLLIPDDDDGPSVPGDRQGTRGGALSLAGIAAIIPGDLARGREQDALRLLFGFADDFRGSGDAGKTLLIAGVPPLTGHAGFDAALAGMAEFFAGEAGLPVPAWADDPGRYALPWFFVTSSPAFHAYVMAHTPIEFAARGVFMAREVFDRV